MASKTEIANMALSHLAIGKEISNLDTERSEEASAFNVALDATLRDFPWPFETSFAALALVEEDPTSEWKYSYRYPTDCSKIKRILSGDRNDNRQGRVPYKLGRDSSGKLIYTDKEKAEIEYTYKDLDPNNLSSDCTLSLSWRLAAYIAPRVTGGDPFKLGDRAMKMYMYEVSIARASSVNEEQSEENPESEFIRARQ
jgi:hypothetical protein